MAGPGTLCCWAVWVGNAMTAYIIRRLLWLLPLLIGVSVICFALLKNAPGDPITAIRAQSRSSGSTIQASDMEALRDQMGLNDPVYVQYVDWLKLAITGDFGY